MRCCLVDHGHQSATKAERNSILAEEGQARLAARMLGMLLARKLGVALSIQDGESVVLGSCRTKGRCG